LKALRTWLDETRPKILPDSALGEALTYLHNHWAGLVRYCDDGRYAMDTNLVENIIRPFCVGRRGWLFCDTVAGAKSSANLYSLIMTALCRMRHSAVHAERRTMPSRRCLRFPVADIADSTLGIVCSLSQPLIRRRGHDCFGLFSVFEGTLSFA
jgi:hypothetical protein